ncbi:endodeoxyribonuclease [Polyrhizophydium stewartii]|uniref:DNA topoisomerase (ATP-hydrolyzing) n=1 Tax=Polyrhizophydium stewartii TaxID=2732419 RepID=A0ABR4N3R0_9FUNG
MSLSNRIHSILERVNTAMRDRYIPALRLSPKTGRARIIKRTGKTLHCFDGFVAVLQASRDQLVAGTLCTKRDVYYRHVALFRSQSQVDRVASCKGLVHGHLRLHLVSGDIVDCAASGHSGVLVPQPETIARIELDPCVSSVLVIEKDAVFFSLLQAGFLDKLSSTILITGKGFPDLATRSLVRRLGSLARRPSTQPSILLPDFLAEFGEISGAESGANSLTRESLSAALAHFDEHDPEKAPCLLPVRVLVDADPDGFEILCTYRFGSAAMSRSRDSLACASAQWMGVRPSEMMRTIPAAKLLPLSQRDRAKLLRMLQRPHIRADTKFRRELGRMLFMNSKCEI